jgi:Zn-dependent protease with chaperone function
MKDIDEKGVIESWMFRVPYENIALIVTLLIISLISYFLYTFNIYIFVLLLIGALIYVHLQQLQYLGNAIRVHSKQYPDIYDTFRTNAEKLGINRASLYIIQDPYLQAYTLGITSCTVVLTSALVEQLNQKELNFVIGHELGHYKAGHTKISTLLVPIGSNNFLSNLIFGFWNRKTEYSCDRCGLIATKDVDSAISALIKISIGKVLYEKLDIKGYVSQIKTANRTSVKFSELLGDHPLTTNRIRNLIGFWRESFGVK